MQRLFSIVILISMLMSFSSQPALAQSLSPSNPTNSQETGIQYLPIAPKDWQTRTPQKIIPVPAIAHGPGQVSAATQSLCFTWLSPTMLASKAGSNNDQYCVGGSQYPGWRLNDSFVSGVESQGKIFGGIAEAESENLALRSDVLNLNGKPDSVSSVFGTSHKISAFPIDFFGTADVKASTLPPVNPEDWELFSAIRLLPWNLSKGIPLPINENIPIYNGVFMALPTTLRMRCGEFMEGQNYWNWYTLFNDDIVIGGKLYLGGLWNTNTDPLRLSEMPTCMNFYRYLSWDDLRSNPEWAAWRQQVLSTYRVYNEMRAYSTYSLPQGIDELGGQWYITYMSAAGGVIMVLYYMVNETITASYGMFIIQDDYLKCLATTTDPNGIKTCYVGGEPAITASDWIIDK